MIFITQFVSLYYIIMNHIFFQVQIHERNLILYACYCTIKINDCESEIPYVLYKGYGKTKYRQLRVLKYQH